MVEKPMAIALEDCDRMIAAAEKKQVKLMVAHTRSFNPPIRKMREIATSGRIGQDRKSTRLNSSHTVISYAVFCLKKKKKKKKNKPKTKTHTTSPSTTTTTHHHRQSTT